MRAAPSLRATPYLVLALGLAATALVTYRLERVAGQRNEIRFQNAVASVHDRLRVRLDLNVTMLLAAKGLFAGSQTVERGEFRRFLANLEVARLTPGIQGIGYSVRLTPEEKPRLEAQARMEGFSDFRVWPDHPRDEYHAIYFLEPDDRRNLAALGYDMRSEANRRRAMDAARDTGKPAATGRVTLVQEIDQVRQPGFLIYVPVYRGGNTPPTIVERRATLRGHVYSAFRSYDFLDGIFGSERSPMVWFEVLDDTPSPREPVLQLSGPAPAGYRPRFQATLPLEVAGTTWRLHLRSTPAFDALSSGGRTLFLAGGGTLLSLVLSLMMAAQVMARSRAEASDRAAQAERAHLHRLFMQAPAPILIQRGPDQILEFMNSTAVALVGARPLGKSVREGFADIDLVQLGFLDRVYATGERFVGAEVAIAADWKRDGQRTTRFLNIVHEPMRNANGQVEGIMTFGIDVTEEVLARRMLEGMADDLRRAVSVRDDFLSVAGHELRTPLAALVLQIEGMERQAARGAYGPEPAVLLERLGKARAHSGRLERLIGELLDVSRITSGHLSLQPEEVDLRALAREVADRFADQLARAGCTFTMVPLEGERIVGHWDRLRLDQLITNLLGNALKYGPGKSIEVLVDRVDDRARLAVTDHGIGISAEDQARIFKRFERAVSDRHYGGLGLGLWISRQIVEAHHGRITVQSAPGAGSTFSVELPL